MSDDPARELRHDLRTPVNHLVGYTELLLEDAVEATLAERLSRIRELANDALKAIAGVVEGDGAAPAAVATLGDVVGELEAVAQGLSDRFPAQAADLARIESAVARLRELTGRLSGAPVQPAAGPSRAVETPAGGEVILVVDDDESNRDMLARRLERLGHATVQAAGGREALDIMGRQAVALALLDVMMPEVDGIAVLAAMKADDRLRSIPVIMVSALDEMDSIVRCIELGAEDYLPKPFDPVLLRARVDASLEKRRLFEMVTQQAEELRAWNKELERRVEEQVREVERLSLMQRFVPPQLAQAIRDGGADLLNSHRRDITVLFCDLRGFTAFAETAEPEDVMAVLADLHRSVGPLIFEFGGTLTQFQGDGMMVLFNDPLPCDDPAWQAVQLALRMQDEAAGLAARWRRLGFDLGLGVGVAAGHATCGQIGFEGRFEYTAIGTVTNLASRLCGEAKAGEVLASERVFTMLTGRIAGEPVGGGGLVLKGFSRPVPVYRLRGPDPAAGPTG